MTLKKFKFRWSDLDANMHIKNTAYNDLFIEHRLDMMANMGLGLAEFKKLGIGPMIIHEHLFYIKEVRADSEIYIDIFMKGKSENGKIMQFAQHLYNEKGELSCYMDLTFGWLDVKARKLTLPPQGIIEAFQNVQKTDDYGIIDSKAFKADHVPYGKVISLPDLPDSNGQ